MTFSPETMKLVALCALTFNIIVAYEFYDSQFNELLDKEMKTIERYVRYADPEQIEDGMPDFPDPPGKMPEVCRPYCSEKRHHHHHHPHHHPHPHHHHHHPRTRSNGCCGRGSFTNSIFPTSSGDFMNQRNCWREVNEKIANGTSGDDNLFDIYSCEKVNRMKKRHICMAECIANNTNLLQDDGSLDINKTKEMIVGKLQEDWQKELLTKAFDKCGNMKVDETWKEGEEYKCNPHALQMKHCIWREVEMNCPEKYQSLERRCQALKENLQKEASRNGAEATSKPETVDKPEVLEKPGGTVAPSPEKPEEEKGTTVKPEEDS